MRRCIMSAVIAGCLFGLATGQDNAPLKEMAALEGTWVGVAFEESGKKAPAEIAETITWIFKGDRFIWRARFVKDERIELEGTCKVDPSKKPKEIDLFDSKKEHDSVGIYELEGDTLKIRFHGAKEPRPKTLTTKGGTSDHFLIVLKRAQKEDKTDALAKEAAALFLKAMKAEDLKAVMRIADVPFFWDGTENIKDRDQLEKRFAGVFAERDLMQIEFKINEVHTFAKRQENLRPKDKELLQEILDKTDRVVVATLTVGDRKAGVAVMVRIRDGKAKVAGFRD